MTVPVTPSPNASADPPWLRDLRDELPPLLSVRDAARLLRRSVDSTRRLVARGTLVGLRTGDHGRLLLPRDAVLEMLTVRAGSSK